MTQGPIHKRINPLCFIFGISKSQSMWFALTMSLAMLNDLELTLQTTLSRALTELDQILQGLVLGIWATAWAVHLN